MIIGLDVGGTHTDVVLLDNGGLKNEIKVATDPFDLFKSVLTGLSAITAGIDPEKIDRIVLSTTLATNAILQHKTPSVAMIVTGGPGIDPEFFRTDSQYFWFQALSTTEAAKLSPSILMRLKRLPIN